MVLSVDMVSLIPVRPHDEPVLEIKGNKTLLSESRNSLLRPYLPKNQRKVIGRL